MDKEQEKALEYFKKELKDLGKAMSNKGILAFNVPIDDFKTAFISLRQSPEYCKECGSVKSNL